MRILQGGEKNFSRIYRFPKTRKTPFTKSQKRLSRPKYILLKQSNRPISPKPYLHPEEYHQNYSFSHVPCPRYIPGISRISIFSCTHKLRSLVNLDPSTHSQRFSLASHTISQQCVRLSGPRQKQRSVRRGRPTPHYLHPDPCHSTKDRSSQGHSAEG